MKGKERERGYSDTFLNANEVIFINRGHLGFHELILMESNYMIMQVGCSPLI